jgi:hypothetical protein
LMICYLHQKFQRQISVNQLWGMHGLSSEAWNLKVS